MQTRIIIENKEISEIIQRYAHEYGYGAWTENRKQKYIENFWSDIEYPIYFNYSAGCGLSWDRIAASVAGPVLNASTQLDKVIELLKKPQAIEVKLDDNNIMTVTKNGVRFGEDNFPLSVIDDLVAARNKVLAK